MIKAIETRYAGCLFRSRLEARWAVFFDTLGVRWEYEKEGYDLGEAGWYLPDFWLPFQGNDRRGYPEYENSGYWVEIKGIEPSKIDQDKILALAKSQPHVIWLFIGDPGNCQRWAAYPRNVGRVGFVKSNWVQKPSLTFTTPEYIIPLWSAFDRLRPNLPPEESGIMPVARAITAARSAQFEHGRSGAR